MTEILWGTATTFCDALPTRASKHWELFSTKTTFPEELLRSSMTSIAQPRARLNMRWTVE
jgi:hypothetical protein